ncbi:MAG: pirin family protein [Neisseriaceae bacterium]|nr:pirin family protein [Neisseriaceae bacterium]
MLSIHHDHQRGAVDLGWLKSQHSFSFGSWHHPDYMGVSVLRVINEDRVQAHTGFGRHAHENMEILTYVLSGRLTHQDSMGNKGHIKAGEWQLMSAGSGITHSEMNDTDETVHFLQIWLYPNVQNAEPSYQQAYCSPFATPNQWQAIVSPTQDTPLSIRQHAYVSALALNAGHDSRTAPKLGTSYIHLIEGEVVLNGQTLHGGDAATLSGPADIHAVTDSHMIWFDLPQ